MTESRPAAGAAWPSLHETGLSVAELDLHGGALFWEEVGAFTGASPLAPLVEETLAGGDFPRLWLFLDEPGETATRAAAALAAARALVARQLSVVVVDGDDRRPDLTRWAGRHEREGWIDFARYGASLAACSVALPWDGPSGRLLGVGSFHPTGASGTEVSWLLSLLGSQADVVLVSAPLGPGGEMWLETGALRLLCWDRSARDSRETARLLASLAEAGRPVQAVVTFGAPGLELLPPPPPAAVEAARSIERFAAAVAAAASDVEAPAASAAGGPPPADAAAPAVRALPLPPVAPDRAPGPEPATEPADAPSRRGGRRGAWAAVVLAVAALAVAWVLGGRPARTRVPLSSLAPPPAGEDISPPAASAAGRGAPPVPRATAPGESVAGATPAGVPAVADTALAVPRAEVPRPPAASAAPAADGTVAATAPDSAAVAAAGTFDPAPYGLPVGRDGWAIHVYSLPDSVYANQQIAALARLGITARWGVVELPAKGRWYRIYMGSFPSREAARAALPALLRRLGETWGQVARF